MAYTPEVPADLRSAGAFEKATYSKVTWRLVPLLFVCYVVAYLDRVNVGFAKLQMLSDLRFSETVYGLGAGIFFIGYMLFEVPSNVILHRVGARLWIARIMITWGLVSAAMVFVKTPATFYIIRFILGLAEAGFFPGVILYITYWYPSHRRAKITALFMASIPISGLIGGPLSGWIMHTFHDFAGLAGWQWTFLIEAAPSLVVGVVVIFCLHDRIRQAHWLSEDEKVLLEKEIAREAEQKGDYSVARTLASPRVWFMSLIYFSFVMGLYGISFWLPSIINNAGVKDPLDVGLLTAIPYAAAVLGMVCVSRSADRRRERRWHIAVPGLLGAAGLILSAVYSQNLVWAMTALTLATLGIITTLPLFWSLPTAFLGGAAAAAGIALINSLGNVAGFVAPYMVGWLKDLTHSANAGLYALAAWLLIGVVATLSVPAHLVNK